MSNVYEEMLLLYDKIKLERYITNLVEEQLNNCDKAEEELNLISKVIDFTLDIEASCTFEVDCPVLTATKNFDSVEDYKDRDHYETAEDAECDGISWDADTSEGSFYWSGRPSVSVEVLGLTEHASDEAKTLWEAQSKEQERQEQLVWKRRRLERAQKELLELQAELSTAEATT